MSKEDTNKLPSQTHWSHVDAMRDEEIDYSEIPELGGEFFSKAALVWRLELTRHGYRVKDLIEQFDAKPAEIKAFFNSTLDARRATQLRDKMLRAGLPI